MNTVVHCGLELARRAADVAGGEFCPTAYPVKDGRVAWESPLALDIPSDFFHAAKTVDADVVVVIWSGNLIDADDPGTQLFRCYCAIVQATGEIIAGGTVQRWSDAAQWSPAVELSGPMPQVVPALVN